MVAMHGANPCRDSIADPPSVETVPTCVKAHVAQTAADQLLLLLLRLVTSHTHHKKVTTATPILWNSELFALEQP